MISIKKTALSLLALLSFSAPLQSMSRAIKVGAVSAALGTVTIGCYKLVTNRYQSKLMAQIGRALKSHDFSQAETLIMELRITLKKKKYSISYRNSTFAQILCEQVYEDNLRGVKWLIENEWILNINARNFENVSPLNFTALNKTLEIAQYLISQGLDASQSVNPKFPNPLQAAVIQQKPESVRFFLEKGIPVNTIRRGKTALDLAQEQIDQLPKVKNKNARDANPENEKLNNALSIKAMLISAYVKLTSQDQFKIDLLLSEVQRQCQSNGNPQIVSKL